MTKEIIDQPNPPALKSRLPDSVSELAVQLKVQQLPEDVNNGLHAYRRAASYIAAGKFHRRTLRILKEASNKNCSHDISQRQLAT
jgi:hypothetical protein